VSPVLPTLTDALASLRNPVTAFPLGARSNVHEAQREADKAWTPTPPNPNNNTCPVHGPGPRPVDPVQAFHDQTVHNLNNMTASPESVLHVNLQSFDAAHAAAVGQISPSDALKAAFNIADFTLAVGKELNAFRKYVQDQGGIEAWARFVDGKEAANLFYQLAINGQLGGS
jgi:hypothetical protein